MYGFKNGERGMKVDIEQLHKLLDTIGKINATLTATVIEKNDEIERLRAALNANAQTLRLHLGEMTAQEMRTVRAAFSWVLAKGKSND
jgi:hypothetical protein